MTKTYPDHDSISSKAYTVVGTCSVFAHSGSLSFDSYQPVSNPTGNISRLCQLVMQAT